MLILRVFGQGAVNTVTDTSAATQAFRIPTRPQPLPAARGLSSAFLRAQQARGDALRESTGLVLQQVCLEPILPESVFLRYDSQLYSAYNIIDGFATLMGTTP